MIIGSFPIGKFTHPSRRSEIKIHEYDFFFGGERNLLWKLLAEVFQREFKTRQDIIDLLEEKGIAIGDVIRSCERVDGGASDSDLKNIEWNSNLLNIIRQHRIKKIYFTSKQVAKWFEKLFPKTDDILKIHLVSPSAQSIRGLARNVEFQEWRKKHPEENSFKFLLNIYRKFFR